MAYGFPALLAKRGRFGKSYPFRGVYTSPRGVLRRTAVPLFTLLLGCVKWHLKAEQVLPFGHTKEEEFKNFFYIFEGNDSY